MSTFLSVNEDRTCVYMSDWSMTAWVRTGHLGAVPPRPGPDPAACKHTHQQLEAGAQAHLWAVAHRGVALLRLQVLFVHLVELVEDARHHRKTALGSALQNWKQAAEGGLSPVT